MFCIKWKVELGKKTTPKIISFTLSHMQTFSDAYTAEYIPVWQKEISLTISNLSLFTMFSTLFNSDKFIYKGFQ